MPPPLDLDRVLREFKGEAPLFPLPSLVLFPDSIVPLRIFEDRYRAMVKDALQGDRLIATALLKPGWETQYAGNPPIHGRVCVGSIVSHETQKDGRYEILLYGLFRAEIRREVQIAPYRKAALLVTADEVHDSQVRDIDERLHRTLDMLPGRRGRVGRMRKIATDLRGASAGPGHIADAAAEAADLETDDRYRILAEPAVLRRFDLLLSMLERRGRESRADDSLPPRVDASRN
jgi:Lon protease-like protein